MIGTPRTSRSLSRSGFTLIELLVTISVIAILVTIVVVAFGRVRQEARRSITDRLLTNVQQAIQVFETDTRYFPPLLVPDTAGYEFQVNAPPYSTMPSMPTIRSATLIVPESQDDPSDALERARYLSEYSLTAYLIGIGDVDGSDASGTNGVFTSTALDDGVAGDGIRDPGRDKSWGGAKDRANHMATTTGRVLGPYLDVGSLDDDLRVDPTTGMYKLYDAFDSPIRYYRYWPKFTYETSTRTQTVERIPYELLDFNNLASHIEFGDTLSLTANRDLFSSEYMLVSAGTQPLEYIRNTPTGQPLEAFGELAYDESTGDATRYVLPTETATLPAIFPSPFDPIWTGTRPFLETNIKRGQQ